MLGLREEFHKGWGLGISGFTLDYALAKCRGLGAALGMQWGYFNGVGGKATGHSYADIVPCCFSLAWATCTGYQAQRLGSSWQVLGSPCCGHSNSWVAHRLRVWRAGPGAAD